MHYATAAHRARVAPVSGRGVRMREPGRPAWRIALAADYDGTDAENAAAARRLGVPWPPEGAP